MVILLAGLLAGAAASPSGAQSPSHYPEDAALESNHALRLFVESLWPEARQRGISRATFERALAQIDVDPAIEELAGSQPEHERTVGEYLGALVSEVRIDSGRAMLEHWSRELGAIEAASGVDRHVLVAVWGIESSYGLAMGGRNVLRSLAMLAWKGGRRSAFGRREYVEALGILERGEASVERLSGSWAGAMGHTQFIPSTFNAYAIDRDGDGRRDIWASVPDALASTANYLKASGWRPGLPAAIEVAPPAGLVGIDLGLERPLAEWQGLGFRRMGAEPWPAAAARAGLLAPAGIGGPVFLITANFGALLRYNNASAYALAVAHLADRLAGRPPLATPWPETGARLGREERSELQRRLAELGFDVGEIDGILGARSIAALRRWQASQGLVGDGFAGREALERLRRTGSLARTACEPACAPAPQPSA